MLKRIITSPFVIFPFLTCLVFWPFTLQLFALKNDALTYYYPVRTLISDALRNGELPLWTPFINMGYPLHADMQSGAWNPIIWIFSFLSNYSLAAFHYELLLYISFAGIGFYFLCREIGCDKKVAVGMGIAFQFCGFIVDSVQFFNCISAACYLPFVFLFFTRMLRNYSIKDALSLAFVMFLLFTGGYPSLFIILSYILLAYGVFSFFVAANKGVFLKRTSPVVGIAALVFCLLSLPAIVSFVQHLPAIERGGRQPLSFVLENSMNPSSSLSIVLPFASTSNEDWLKSSILMRSIYIGILPLVFLIALFFNKQLRRNRQVQFYLVAAATLLALAWGEHFFLRKMAYYVLPLMDSFRHPALFRLFAIFFLLLSAAVSMQYWTTNKQASTFIFRRIFYMLIFTTAVIAIWALIKTEKSALINLMDSPGPTALANLSFASRVLIQIPFVFFIVVTSSLAVVKKKNSNLVMLVIIADMFCATQLNMPVTVMGAKPFSEVVQTVNRNPVKFPLPGNNSIKVNSANSLDELYLTGSKIPFTKKIGRNNYFITPGNLLIQEAFYESGIASSVFKNPVLYFADSLIKEDTPKNYYSAKIAFSASTIANEQFKPGKQNINLLKLSANSWEADISNTGSGLLILLQNNYPGWQAYLDDKRVSISPVNIAFMAIRTTPGRHVVRFIYQPKFVHTAFYISLLTLIILLLLWLFPFLPYAKKRNAKRKADAPEQRYFQ